MNQFTGIILIVEDDPLVLLSATDVLEGEGYTVLQASDADEAITLLEAHPDIRIVFTDIEMPGSMDGMKLAACVRDRWPPVEIIITSGRVLSRDVALPTRGLFLPKPYRPHELTDRIKTFI